MPPVGRLRKIDGEGAKERARERYINKKEGNRKAAGQRGVCERRRKVFLDFSKKVLTNGALDGIIVW